MVFKFINKRCIGMLIVHLELKATIAHTELTMLSHYVYFTRFPITNGVTLQQLIVWYLFICIGSMVFKTSLLFCKFFPKLLHSFIYELW